MAYKKMILKEGITLHNINTEKFKTNLCAVFLTFPLEYQNATKDTLIALMLKRGSKNLKTREEITSKLAELYGAELDSGIEKSGDNHVLKFYLESLNEEYLPKKEDLLKQSISVLLDIVFNPNINNNEFNKEYLEQEKNNLEQIINSKIDNKAMYALNRTIEEMYKGKPYGIYKYGYVEQLKEITAQNLYEYYKKLIDTCKIDIFVSGNNINVEDLKDNPIIKELKERKSNYVKQGLGSNENKEKVVEEKMDISQGKLIIGMDLNLKEDNLKFGAQVYNTILGGSASSKLFKNVREKASLAYTVSSNYMKLKSNIFIRAGIEIENYDKTLEIIKEQLKDMEESNFSEEDIMQAKRTILSSINNIEEEQDIELSYYYGQELSDKMMTIEEYKNNIEKVTREEINSVAKSLSINTIYFLRN
ncbi:MAG: pitrilysin family protein [Clostridia bacterium]|jgi:predicted Zn-dependent peptidase|nr:pitrilysin family protein [Clostridia bacterium]